MNPILLDLGFVQITWYSIFLFAGFLFGGCLLVKESRRFEIEEDFIINMFFYLVPLSIIGARIYYVAFNWNMYSENLIDIFKIWEGGLSIFGGIIVSSIFIIFYAKKHSYSVLKILDMCSVGLIIGQFIGRWGDFFNKGSYGAQTTYEALKASYLPKFIIDGMNINGIYYQPAFLYEAIWNLFGFIFLLIIRRRRHVKVGQVCGFYLIWYGIGRYFIENIRTDNLIVGNVNISQIIAITSVFIGLLLILANAFKGRFNNNYNEV